MPTKYSITEIPSQKEKKKLLEEIMKLIPPPIKPRDWVDWKAPTAQWELAETALQSVDLSGQLHLDQTSSQTITWGQPILDTLTASQPVFTDASKKLTNTWPWTDAQFIKWDGSLDGTVYGSILSVWRPWTSKTNSTASDQDFTALCTIPANTFTTNKVLRVTINFRQVTGSATVTLKWYLKLWTTKIIATWTWVDVGNSLDFTQSCQFILMGTTSPWASVWVEWMSVASTAPWLAVWAAAVNSVSQPVSVATNGDLDLKYWVAWSATGSTETVTILSYLVESLN